MHTTNLIAIASFAAIALIDLALFSAELPTEAPLGQESECHVLVSNYAGVDQRTVSAAMERAAEIFRQTGVSLRWRELPADPDEAGQTRWAGDAYVRILPHSMTVRLTSSERRMGTSFGRLAYVFYDYVEQFRNLRPEVPREQLLAHVLVHELAHLLLGADSHSARGMMRARWDPNVEMRQMVASRLRFSSNEAKRIRLAVEALRTKQ